MAWRSVGEGPNHPNELALVLTVALVVEVALIFHAKRARLQRLRASDAFPCSKVLLSPPDSRS
jgi:hypothetical protein